MTITSKKTHFEYFLFTIMLFLIVFGLIVLYSASQIEARRLYDNSLYFFMRQSIFCVVGITLTLVISFLPYNVYLKFSKYIYITVLVLVVVTAFSGRISRGASRWINLRGVTFQPSELMKLAIILYLPKVIKEVKCNFDNKENFIRVMIVAYIPTFVVALANLSTGIILFVIATSMLYLISKKKLIFVFILTIFIVAYLFPYDFAKILNSAGLLKGYQMGRIFAWKEPENYPDVAYQTLQGLYAIGSGKLFGRGYLNSIQKNIIPESQNDMIFAILSEELGLVGGLLFLVLYFLLVVRIFYISSKQKEIMPLLITFGIGIHIALQVILNISVVTNLMPNTGVTLPFVSYGGTSLIVTFIEIGIVMQISKKSVYEIEDGK